MCVLVGRIVFSNFILGFKKIFYFLACLLELNSAFSLLFSHFPLCVQHFIIILQGVWNIRLAKMCILCSETCTTLFQANQRCVTPFIIVCTKSLIFKKNGVVLEFWKSGVVFTLDNIIVLTINRYLELVKSISRILFSFDL